MNRKQRRARERPEEEPQGRWVEIFNAEPMLEGMPPHFLLNVLNEKEGFVRYGKLVTAVVWLQSQMAALICLQEDPELIKLASVENGARFPQALHLAATKKLEAASGSIREEFLGHFGSDMSAQLVEDLKEVGLYRDGFAHGYLTLFTQIMGAGRVMWAPRPTKARAQLFDAKGLGSQRVVTMNLSQRAFDEVITRICRVMDFIAQTLKQWGILYPVFV